MYIVAVELTKVQYLVVPETFARVVPTIVTHK
jgi:hypothetical protein